MRCFDITHTAKPLPRVIYILGARIRLHAQAIYHGAPLKQQRSFIPIQHSAIRVNETANRRHLMYGLTIYFKFEPALGYNITWKLDRIIFSVALAYICYVHAVNYL